MSRTVSVFEHQTLRVSSQPGSAAALSPQEFAALARFNDANDQRYFRLGHQSVTFRNFVGYLQVGTLNIEVLPKPDRGMASGEPAPWRGMLLEMLSIALGLKLHVTGQAQQALEQPTLLDIVVSQFVGEVERLAHEGLARGYRSEQTNGSTFRGRLLFSEHIRENHSRADRCYVQYTTFDRDIPVNRALKTALSVAARAPLSSPVLSRVKASLAAFDTTTSQQPSAKLFERIVLGRSTERYREALTLAKMLIENLAPALQAGRSPVFALLFDMNALWEGYIGALFKRCHPQGVQVSLQSPRSFWHPPDSSARTLRPDIVLTSSDGKTLAVLDTKWKVLLASGPADDDLKQMFVYNEIFSASHSLLVYPAALSSGTRLSAAFAGRSHRCSTLELGLEHGDQTWTAAVLAQVRGVSDGLMSALAAEGTLKE